MEMIFPDLKHRFFVHRKSRQVLSTDRLKIAARKNDSGNNQYYNYNNSVDDFT